MGYGPVTAALDVANLAVKSLAGQGLLEKLKWLFRKRHKVLVLGASGTGKSNLLLSLQELMPSIVDAAHRTGNIEVKQLSIAESAFDFIDTPGQSESFRIRERAIRNALEQELCCILNIVCYGYHETRDSSSAAFDASGHVAERYLRDCRHKEVEMVREWSSLIGPGRRAELITVVTKADLWWGQRERVLSYYADGEYLEALGPARNLPRAVTGYSSVRKRFCDRGQVDSTFDQDDAVSLRANLLTLLLSGVDREHRALA